MSGSHITQPRDRKSKRYQDTHAELRAEVYVTEKFGSLSHLTPKQMRHFAKNELFRLYGEQSP